MTPFQMQALAMLCAAASQGGSASTNCNVFLIEFSQQSGPIVTPLTSLGTFAIGECAGPALSQATKAVILGGDIYRLSNDILVKMELGDALAGSWDAVYLPGNSGYGLRNGDVYKLQVSDGSVTCTLVRQNFSDTHIASSSNGAYVGVGNALGVTIIANNGSIGYAGKVISLSSDGTNICAVLKDLSFNSRKIRTRVYDGISDRYQSDYLDPATAMVHENFLTIISTSGTLRVIDMVGTSGFTPAEGTVFKSCTICKGNDVYFYAIDENSVLHRFRGMDETTYPSAGWTEISGDSVAYGIRNGMLYRVDPSQHNGAPQQIGNDDNWIHAWPLSDGKVVALAYA